MKPLRCSQGPRGRAWLSWLVVLFLTALLPRLYFSAQFERTHPQAQRLEIDEGSYDRWAREIADGDWLGDEIFFQEPLYPYTLGVLYRVAGPEPAAQRALARRAQAVLGALTAVLLALLGAQAISRPAGLVAGFALALYRPAIWMGALLLKPGLFLPLFTLLALVLLSTRGLEPARTLVRLARWLALGLLAGLGALLRGNMLLLTPVFCVWPLARAWLGRKSTRPALGSCAAVLLGVVLVLLPVALRNHAVGGRLVLTTSGAGTNFYAGNNPYNPYGLATEFPWVRGVPEHEAGDWRHEAERRLGRTLDPTEVSRFWLGEALQSARRDPALHLSILWNRLRLTLGAYEVPDNHFIEWDARHVPFLSLPLPGFALWGTLGLAGLFLCVWSALRGPAKESGPALELAALFGLYLATIVVTVVSDRMRLALVPMLLPFAGAWVVGLRRPVRELTAALVSLAMAAGVVLTPVLSAEKRQSDLDERDHNLAVSLLREPVDLDGAEALTRALETRYPGDPRVLILSAEVDYRLARRLLDEPGRSDEATSRAESLLNAALWRLERAHASDKPRERFQAQALAGALLQFLGRWAEAEERYRSALGFDPSDRDLRRRLAVTVAEQAVLAPDPDLRRAGLQEALTLVEELLAEEPEAELEALAGRFRSALGS